MSTTINLYGNPDGNSWGVIQESAKNANGLQTQFAFILHEERSRLPADSAIVNFNALSDAIEEAMPTMRGLFFCEGTFDNDCLVNERLPDRIYVACDLPMNVKSPPFRLYLLYQMAAAALTLTAGLSAQLNREMIHKPPIGCLWDWWTNPKQQSAAMVAARICPDCQNALRIHCNASRETIFACQQILDYIRRSMMGESLEIANRVFIAYGRGDDWMTLRDLLQSWGLQVEHFNRESVAGLLIADRWQQMLNRARFAFAVMTPDDEMKNGTKRARQNVIHEIGLCHARVGLHNTAILLAAGTEKFTNVDGVNYISFKVGKLAAQKGEIRKLLEERGIL
jgi:hypothetical protein